MKKWESFSKEEIENIIKEVHTYAELSKRLGYNGSTRFEVVRDMVKELNLDASHFCHPRKGKFDYSRFVYGKEMKGSGMLQALIALRGYKCEMCGLTHWLGNPIVLEVHHKDGDRLNNVLENLQLLCPNCHSTTSNWKCKNIDSTTPYVTDEEIINAMQDNKNIRQTLKDAGLSDHGSNYRRIKKIAERNNIVLHIEEHEKINHYCIDCGKEISYGSTRCGKCNREFIKRKNIEQLPVSRDELKSIIRINPFTRIGEMFGVSDNAVRKWCKKLELPYKTSEIKKYSDDEWYSI